MADVFISYAREDRPFAAQLLRTGLEAGGRSVWWDREILPGKDFAELIAAELARAKAVVVIWSAASTKSGWVRDEAHEGLERGVLVPVLMGVSEPPIGYRSIHAVDLTGWQGGEHPGLADLELAVDSLRSGVPVPDRVGAGTGPVAPPALADALRWVAAGLLAVALAAAAFVLLPSLVQWRDNPDRPPVPTSGGGRRARAVPRLPGVPADGAAADGQLPHGRLLVRSRFAVRRAAEGRRHGGGTLCDRADRGDVRPMAGLRHGRRLPRREPDDSGFGRGTRPVIDVDWNDAQAYVAWLRQSTGKPYRLPSEAEWEYACRAGTTSSYPFGEAIGPALANYGRNLAGTREVGSYPPNPWGLYDMNGNVWEWVEDVWNAGHSGRPADAAAADDWTRPAGARDPRRILGRP